MDRALGAARSRNEGGWTGGGAVVAGGGSGCSTVEESAGRHRHVALKSNLQPHAIQNKNTRTRSGNGSLRTADPGRVTSWQTPAAAAQCPLAVARNAE
jgi:hypothetical protein